jgi:hypothetical protein
LAEHGGSPPGAFAIAWHRQRCSCFEAPVQASPAYVDADLVIELVGRVLLGIATWTVGLFISPWVWAVIFVIGAILIIELG